MVTPGDHIFWLLILSILFIGLSIVLSYISRWEAVLSAFAALLLGYFSRFIYLDSSALWFWGAATLIVSGISFLLPSQVRDSKVGVAYFVTGALAGAFIGMLLKSVAGVILACTIGTLLASVAYGRTPAGSVLDFPKQKFFNYLCAKGLPLVVIYSMLGILSVQLIVVGSTI